MNISEEKIVHKVKVDRLGIEFFIVVGMIGFVVIANIIISVSKSNIDVLGWKIAFVVMLLLRYYPVLQKKLHREVQEMTFTDQRIQLQCRAEKYQWDLDQITITKRPFGNSRFQKELHISPKSIEELSLFRRLFYLQAQPFVAVVNAEEIRELEKLLANLDVEYHRH